MALITLRQLLDHAAEQGYGVPAFNINNMEQGLAILKAAAEVAKRAPTSTSAIPASDRRAMRSPRMPAPSSSATTGMK